ncbi:MAG: hypothetical protein HQM09_17650 [Candidatus Riflebacteria bacterium]|nr:hypothetical protein [Candidatus Riflebacteria bacterium]
MTRDGYWINADTGHFEQIDDHAEYLVVHDNAVRIGLGQEHEKLIRRFDWDLSRFIILTIAMEAGLIRVRGHEDRITCEFTLPLKLALPRLVEFFKKTGLPGPFTLLEISNLKEMIGAEMLWKDFEILAAQSPETWSPTFKDIHQFPEYEYVQEGLRLSAAIGS